MRGLVSPPLALGACIMLLSACSTDKLDGDEMNDGGTVGDGDGDTSSSNSGDGDGDEIPDGGPARGIHVTEVEANQGTAILIGKDGAWVGPEERNAFMIRDRDTLIRLQHTVDENWIPREITGVLHLRDAEGNELEPRVRTFFVETSSEPRNLSTEFFFSVLADEAQPGLSYWVELLEATDTDVSGLSEGLTITPEDYALIGYEQTPLEMKIMLVPIRYNYLNPPTLVEPNEADLQQVYDDLLQNDPLQTIDLQVHEPYDYNNQLTNLGQLLSPMAALRGNEGADPNVYYHALVDVHGGGVNMVAGIANLAANTKDAASQRVAATVWFKTNDAPPTGSTGTIVHEIGHNQGLSHVYCSEQSSPAAGPDPNYPHEDGVIGVFGFGIRNFRLYTPNGAHDYMTYCGNAWVSDWTWNKTYQRIRTLTSWDYEGGAAPMPENVPLLVGTLFPDGSEDWWVMMGPAPAAESIGGEHRIALARGGLVDELYTAVVPVSDGQTQMLIAPLSGSLDDIDTIARLDWRGDVHPIELAALHIDAAVQLAH